MGEQDADRELGFDDFYRQRFAGLVALAAAVLGRRAGADDIAQEVMVDAYRRWDRLGAYDAPAAWARRCVVQRALKVIRRESNERRSHERLERVRRPDPAPAELDPELRDALGVLSDQQRAALALHYLEDVPVRAIAEALGVSEGTVKVHLSRGRERLRGVVGEPRGERDQEVDHDR